MDKYTGRTAAAALAFATLLAIAGGAHAQVVISQVYGGGGNGGAPFENDFIELHNNGATAVDLAGWSVQYASTAGTTWQRTNLSGSIAPGGYYLVQQAKGANASTPLPTPDATGTISMSATAGKVALANHTTTLSGACPTGNVDFVGFGSGTNCAEGTVPTASLSATIAALRAQDGCADSNHNGNDFGTGTPIPRNGASPLRACVATLDPLLTIEDVAADERAGSVLFMLKLSRPAGPGGVRVEYATIDATATAGEDYVARTGTITLPEGVAGMGLSIDVVDDSAGEDDETFFLQLHDVQGALIGTPRVTATLIDDDYTLTAIHAVQGSGERSPLEGRTVHVRGIVTGRKNNGFFLQAPDAEADNDPMTSEGVFVFTRSAPPAEAVAGNTVVVRGQVTEFIPSGADAGQTPLTEIVSTRVTLESVPPVQWPGMLPTPVVLTATFPDPSGPLDQLERVEGMRVTIPQAVVAAPTQGNTDQPNATGSSNGILHVVVEGVARPFREPGIALPDPVPGGANPAIPRWDFSPELITLNSSGLGGPAWNLPFDSRIGGLTGPLDYGFRRYTILRDPLALTTIAPGPRSQPRPAVTLAPLDPVSVASYNVERFFDNVDDPALDDETLLTAAAFERRLRKLSLGVRDYLHSPDILGLIEVENLTVLERIAQRINQDAVAAGQPDPGYAAHLLEGNDVGGIDVGFLVRTAGVDGAPRVEVASVTQLGKDTRWTEPNGGSSLLNDRPPLLLDAVVRLADGRRFPLSVVLVHQRSLIGAEADTAAGDRIRRKRQAQAEFLATSLAQLQSADPARRLVVLGDFNAFAFNDGLADVMNTLAGTPSPDAATVVPGDGIDLIDPDLVDLGSIASANERYSYVFDGNAQTLDHVLVNEQMVVDTSRVVIDHARINADFPQTNRNDADSPSRLSDHDPVRVDFVARRRADLAVTASAATAEVRVGRPLAFTAQLLNHGPDRAEFPGIGFAVDAELPDLSVVPDQDAWHCEAAQVDAGRTTVACVAYEWSSGATVNFTVGATATPALAGRSVSLAVAAQAQSLDPVASNDAADAHVGVVALADLGLLLTGPARHLRAGTAGHYLVVASNLGPDAAPRPRLTLRGDAPAANVDVRAPGWQCELADAGDGFEAVCARDSLAPWVPHAVAFTIVAPPRNGDGRLTVTARIDGAVRDGNARNDSDTHGLRLIGRPH